MKLSDGDKEYFYDDQAKAIIVYKLDEALHKSFKGSIYEDKSVFFPSYPKKPQSNNGWVDLDEKIDVKCTHFYDEGYDSIRIGLHYALKKAGILLEREYNDIEGTLKEVRESR